jgi:Vitamin K-dependent gamma-carboxylase
MSFDAALRLTDMLLGYALLQQSLEHLASARDERVLFVSRAVLSVLLILGVTPAMTATALLGLGAAILRRFDGPYNGGSDRMSLLTLMCVCLAHLLPDPHWRQAAFAYLAMQLVLSYGVSGWVKVINPDWRSGRALRDVFLFSAYPVSENLRRLDGWPRLLLAMSWSVMLFELLFPLALLARPALLVGLVIAAAFHVTNACLFGLNRFVWAWLAAYPSILWLQQALAGRGAE